MLAGRAAGRCTPEEVHKLQHGLCSTPLHSSSPQQHPEDHLRPQAQANTVLADSNNGLGAINPCMRSGCVELTLDLISISETAFSAPAVVAAATGSSIPVAIAVDSGGFPGNDPFCTARAASDFGVASDAGTFMSGGNLTHTSRGSGSTNSSSQVAVSASSSGTGTRWVPPALHCQRQPLNKDNLKVYNQLQPSDDGRGANEGSTMTSEGTSGVPGNGGNGGYDTGAGDDLAASSLLTAMTAPSSSVLPLQKVLDALKLPPPTGPTNLIHMHNLSGSPCIAAWDAADAQWKVKHFQVHTHSAPRQISGWGGASHTAVAATARELGASAVSVWNLTTNGEALGSPILPPVNFMLSEALSIELLKVPPVPMAESAAGSADTLFASAAGDTSTKAGVAGQTLQDSRDGQRPVLRRRSVVADNVGPGITFSPLPATRPSSISPFAAYSHEPLAVSTALDTSCVDLDPMQGGLDSLDVSYSLAARVAMLHGTSASHTQQQPSPAPNPATSIPSLMTASVGETPSSPFSIPMSLWPPAAVPRPDRFTPIQLRLHSPFHATLSSGAAQPLASGSGLHGTPPLSGAAIPHGSVSIVVRSCGRVLPSRWWWTTPRLPQAQQSLASVPFARTSSLFSAVQRPKLARALAADAEPSPMGSNVVDCTEAPARNGALSFRGLRRLSLPVEYSEHHVQPALSPTAGRAPSLKHSQQLPRRSVSIDGQPSVHGSCDEAFLRHPQYGFMLNSSVNGGAGAVTWRTLDSADFMVRSRNFSHTLHNRLSLELDPDLAYRSGALMIDEVDSGRVARDCGTSTPAAASSVPLQASYRGAAQSSWIRRRSSRYIADGVHTGAGGGGGDGGGAASATCIPGVPAFSHGSATHVGAPAASHSPHASCSGNISLEVFGVTDAGLLCVDVWVGAVLVSSLPVVIVPSQDIVAEVLQACASAEPDSNPCTSSTAAAAAAVAPAARGSSGGLSARLQRENSAQHRPRRPRRRRMLGLRPVGSAWGSDELLTCSDDGGGGRGGSSAARMLASMPMELLHMRRGGGLSNDGGPAARAGASAPGGAALPLSRSVGSLLFEETCDLLVSADVYAAWAPTVTAAATALPASAAASASPQPPVAPFVQHNSHTSMHMVQDDSELQLLQDLGGWLEFVGAVSPVPMARSGRQLHDSAEAVCRLCAPNCPDLTAHVVAELRRPHWREMYVECALGLLTFACARGWLHTASTLLDQLLLVSGRTFDGLLAMLRAASAEAAAEAAAGGAAAVDGVVGLALQDGVDSGACLGLLHHAVLSGSQAMLQLIMDWGEQYGSPLHWTDPSPGPAQLTPLHLLAACAGQLVPIDLVDWVLASWPEARTAWDTLADGQGVTPAQYLQATTAGVTVDPASEGVAAAAVAVAYESTTTGRAVPPALQRGIRQSAALAAVAAAAATALAANLAETATAAAAAASAAAATVAAAAAAAAATAAATASLAAAAAVKASASAAQGVVVLASSERARALTASVVQHFPRAVAAPAYSTAGMALRACFCGFDSADAEDHFRCATTSYRPAGLLAWLFASCMLHQLCLLKTLFDAHTGATSGPLLPLLGITLLGQMGYVVVLAAHIFAPFKASRYREELAVVPSIVRICARLLAFMGVLAAPPTVRLLYASGLDVLPNGAMVAVFEQSRISLVLPMRLAFAITDAALFVQLGLHTTATLAAAHALRTHLAGVVVSVFMCYRRRVAFLHSKEEVEAKQQ